MKQAFLVRKSPKTVDILGKADIVNPALSEYVIFDYKPTGGLQYDFVVSSAHDENSFLQKSKHTRLILVISYLPSMESKEWPNFYTNLCLCDLIACDSWIKKQLADNGITYPEKPIIPLDGCTPSTGKLRLSIEEPFHFATIDQDLRYWNRFADIVHENDYRVTTSFGHNTIMVGFNPMSPVLASYLTHHYGYLTVGYDEFTAQYLDSRQINKVALRLQNLIDMPGSAGAKPIRDAMTEFLGETIQLVEHSNGKELQYFKSNVDIYTRIFHNLNSRGV